MPKRRGSRICEELQHRAADYFALNANRDALITITSADASSDLKRLTIYLTVYPEEREDAAIAFAKRRRSDFREFLKKTTRLKYIPTIDFAIDKGDKNRRRIEELLKE